MDPELKQLNRWQIKQIKAYFNKALQYPMDGLELNNLDEMTPEQQKMFVRMLLLSQIISAD